jgi:sialate O-acetylesterase
MKTFLRRPVHTALLVSIFVLPGAVLLAAPTVKTPIKPAASIPKPEVKTPASAPVVVSDQDTSGMNLLPNPSFEQDAKISDEKSLPGWELMFRRQAEAPLLSTEEVSIIDDPKQAHSGRRFLRIQAKDREIALRAPRPEKLEAGLYEVSVWARGREGTLVAAGVSYPPAGFGAGLHSLNGEWRKYSIVTYSPEVAVTKLPWPDQAQFFLAVFAPGERGQMANPQLDIDDVSVTRLTCGLADTFSDHMVLQRDKPVPIWGWAKTAGQSVTVNFNGQQKIAVADKDGRWQVTLAPMKAGGPYILKVDGRPAAYDVMMGDVWICSGQSNMEFGLDLVNGYYGHAPEVLARVANPQIRVWQAPKQFSPTPLHNYLTRQSNPQYHNDYQARWDVSTPDVLGRGIWGGFSAVGYFFGRDIQADQKVPVGLMMIANGGTQIESFISPEGMQSVPKNEWTVPEIPAADIAKLTNTPLNPQPEGMGEVSAAYAELAAGRTIGGPANGAFNFASSAYNGLVSPVFPMAVKGVIWYQGEHNGGDRNYETKLKALIADWRARFKDPKLPFVIAQLPLWSNGNNGGWPFVREAQLKVSQSDPNVGLAVTLDLADTEGYAMAEIHPKKKEPVGQRMALAARKVAYGEKVTTSPSFRSMKIEGNKAVISFDSVGGGLVAQGDKLIGFQIADEDKKFVAAEATIVGNTVVVSAPEVSTPVAVRYAFVQATLPVPNLYNKEGLPASPFRTDNWTQ